MIKDLRRRVPLPIAAGSVDARHNGLARSRSVVPRTVARSANPFIAPHLISGSGFGTVNLINAVFGGITIGAVALVPLYATNRYGLSAFDAGTLLVAQVIATVLLSVAVTLMLRRTGYRLPF